MESAIPAHLAVTRTLPLRRGGRTPNPRIRPSWPGIRRPCAGW